MFVRLCELVWTHSLVHLPKKLFSNYVCGWNTALYLPMEYTIESLLVFRPFN